MVGSLLRSLGVKHSLFSNYSYLMGLSMESLRHHLYTYTHTFPRLSTISTDLFQISYFISVSLCVIFNVSFLRVSRCQCLSDGVEFVYTLVSILEDQYLHTIGVSLPSEYIPDEGPEPSVQTRVLSLDRCPRRKLPTVPRQDPLLDFFFVVLDVYSFFITFNS